MKSKIAFALAGMLLLVGISYSQNGNLQIMDLTSVAIDPSIETVSISYTGLENTDPRLYEAVFFVSTREECLASHDFSRAVRLRSDRATYTYDPATGTNRVKWLVDNADKQGCRVLLVRGAAAASGYNTWRANYGASVGLAGEVGAKDDAGVRAQRSLVTSLTVTFQGNTVP